MAATGLVSLPGMMTGQILAGVSPPEAVKYQLLVMFLIGGFGGGDAKLLVALGPVLGLQLYLRLLFAVALTGGVLALVAMVRRKRDLAYGPAIAIGMLMVTLWNGCGGRP